MATYDKVKRSQAARKGWVKRRLKAYESGKLTKEEFIHIYNIEPEAMKPEYITDYYVNGAKIDIQTGEILAIDEYYDEYKEQEKQEQEEIDSFRITYYEISMQRIKSTILSTQVAPNMADTLVRLIDDVITNLDEKEFIQFGEDVVEQLDMYSFMFMQTSNVDEAYEDAGIMVTLIVTSANKYGYEDTIESWQTDLHKSYRFDNSSKTRNRNRRKRK